VQVLSPLVLTVRWWNLEGWWWYLEEKKLVDTHDKFNISRDHVNVINRLPIWHRFIPLLS
jgi:hypothetical protein